jgi:hypothetical protein
MSAAPARLAIDEKIALQTDLRALRLSGSGKTPVLTVAARRDLPALSDGGDP